MGGTWADLMGVLHVAICITALLAAAAYWKFHLWWATGFGRARLSLLLSIAVLAGSHAITFFWPGIDYDFNNLPDGSIAATILASTTGVLISAAYMFYNTCALNLRRARHPETAASLGREHLRRTPMATQDELGKLLACWDEMHSSG